jgi:hypothetical protein
MFIQLFNLLRTNYRGFEAFTAVTIEFVVFWVVAQCSVVVGYVSENHDDSFFRDDQRWYPTPTLQGATTHRTMNSN